MEDKSKQSKREDLETRAAGVALAVLTLFGMIQFVVVAIITLFGVELSWLQYLASTALLALAIVIFIFGGWENE